MMVAGAGELGWVMIVEAEKMKHTMMVAGVREGLTVGRYFFFKMIQQ